MGGGESTRAVRQGPRRTRLVGRGLAEARLLKRAKLYVRREAETRKKREKKHRKLGNGGRINCISGWSGEERTHAWRHRLPIQHRSVQISFRVPPALVLLRQLARLDRKWARHNESLGLHLLVASKTQRYGAGKIPACGAAHDDLFGWGGGEGRRVGVHLGWFG
jgi:hypothetical protein